jgi:chromosome segregation ATPase
MAERDSPFTVMKRFLTAMNKRIDDLGTKTNSLEEDIKRFSEQNASERSRMSDKFDSEKVEVNSKLEELTSKAENNQSQLMQAIEQLKQNIEQIKSSSASREDLHSMESSLKDEIAMIREQKLEKVEFNDFVEKNNASMKEVFSELTPSESFAEFATEQVSSRPAPTPIVEEVAPASEAPSENPEPVEKEQTPADRFTPEQRREEKRKKKWL